jgi:hypothetical protein
MRPPIESGPSLMHTTAAAAQLERRHQRLERTNVRSVVYMPET